MTLRRLAPAKRMSADLARELMELRGELQAYLCRLVIRAPVAEDLVQTTFLRALEAAGELPESPGGRRAWVFRVATNLAFDELRRHSTWRESMLGDLRTAAESNPAIVARSAALASTPETREIAREHLVACLACTLRNLPERHAAALLLVEIYDFAVADAAEILESTANQVKNWLQSARSSMRERYEDTCALIAKRGVCHQCVELNGFFATEQGPPLAASDDHVARRLEIARALRARSWGPWHRLVFELLDELGDGAPPRRSVKDR